MSIRNEIYENCEKIISKKSEIEKENRVSDFVTVRSSYQLRNKNIPRYILSGLEKRLTKPHTNNEVDKIFEGVKKVVESVNNEEKLLRELKTKNMPSYLYYDKNGNLKIDYKKFARYLQDELHIIYYPTSGQLFIYDNDAHCYRSEKTGNEIDVSILKLMEERDITSSSLIYVSNEITKHLKSMENQEEYPFNNSRDTIPVKNGVLKLDYKTGEVTLLPHGPEHHFTYTLCADWNPDVSESFARDSLKKWVCDKNIDDLIQVAAQCIAQRQLQQQMKRATLIIGMRNTGKSKYHDFIIKVFGKQYVSAVSLQEIGSNRFATGCLENAVINFVDDMDNIALGSVSLFKDLTGSIYHPIERKGIQPYQGVITCGWCFTCNFPPTIVEKIKRDAAFWIRWNVVLFENIFPEVNGKAEEDIFTDEMCSSFLKCIVNMVIKIHQNGRLISEHTVDEVMTKWISHCDSVTDFVDNGGFEPVGSGGEPIYYVKEALKKIYDDYGAKAGFAADQILPRNAFYANVQSHGFIPMRKEVKLADGTRKTFECFRSWLRPAGEKRIDNNYYIKTDKSPYGEINPLSECVLENVSNKVDISSLLLKT